MSSLFLIQIFAVVPRDILFNFGRNMLRVSCIKLIEDEGRISASLNYTIIDSDNDFGANLLARQMLICCQLDPIDNNFMEFSFSLNIMHFECHLKIVAVLTRLQ